MEVISIDSKAYEELMNRLNKVCNFVESYSPKTDFNIDDEWVDNNDVCSYLHVSEKSLYRLRIAEEISYSPIRGRYYYQIKEIKRMLQKKLIRSKKEYLKRLILHCQEVIEKIINKQP